MLKKIKLCIVTEFEQEKFFQWTIALSGNSDIEVSTTILSENILTAYPLDDKHWHSIREADVVFVYCVRQNLNWEWYKLPFLVKKIMNPNAKMICQFDLEFLWLWYPHHHFWKKEVSWAEGKTPKQFFKETGVMNIADAYIILFNDALKKYTKKPVYSLQLPQLSRYRKFLDVAPSRKDFNGKSKKIVVLKHSVKSASIEFTLERVIRQLNFPTAIFTSRNTDSMEKLEILKTLPQYRRSVVYGNIPRDAYMDFLQRCFVAIDDNEGYHGWSRFVMECALVHVPCIGSTRAVKEFFPELYTEPKDYRKQTELLERLYKDKQFWLKMAVTGKKLVLKKMDSGYLVNKLIKIMNDITKDDFRKNPIAKIMSLTKREPSVKTVKLMAEGYKDSADDALALAKEFEEIEPDEYSKYLSFRDRYLPNRVIPPRPPSDGSVFDKIQKRIITQNDWDVSYGKWREFIEGGKPKSQNIPILDLVKKTKKVKMRTKVSDFKRKFPLLLEDINPILMIMSPRDIDEVSDAYSEIDYVDKVWFKYFDKPTVLKQIDKFFKKHIEYTHLIIVSDDVVCFPDSIRKLMESILIYDFPVLSGCFNLCNTWENPKRYCTKCERHLSHDHINITFDPIDFSKKITIDSYNWVSEKWRKNHLIIKRVWFEGFALAMIRRDIYEKIGFRGIGFQHTTDIPWAVDLAEANIPQFCDFRIKLEHRSFHRDRKFFVNEKPSCVVFQSKKLIADKLKILIVNKMVTFGKKSVDGLNPNYKPALKSLMNLKKPEGSLVSTFSINPKRFGDKNSRDYFSDEYAKMQKYAKENDFDFMFMVDPNIILPKDALIHLIKTNGNLVCGVTSKKPSKVDSSSWSILMSRKTDDKVKKAIKQNKIFHVAGYGSGVCTLLDRKAIETDGLFTRPKYKNSLNFTMWDNARRKGLQTLCNPRIKCQRIEPNGTIITGKLKVLIVVDVYGWAFDFMARNIKNYGKHDYTIVTHNEVSEEDAIKYDVIFVFHWTCWWHKKHQRAFEKAPIRKIIGIRGEKDTLFTHVIKGWRVGTVSKAIYDKLIISDVEREKVFWTRNGVDTEIFKPTEKLEKDRNRFVVGWAGNPNVAVKRYKLLENVQFSLLTQVKWGKEHFKKGRSREEMVEFYKKIDVFINVSESEGMPQSILEAAACGLPIIVTNVGGMPEFVDKEWVIPVKEDICIRELNKKLFLLKQDPELRLAVGQRNLKRVEKDWNMKEVVKDYDRMFEEI